MKIAALDLGTNTFLCLIAEGHAGKLTKIHGDFSEVVRLGQGVDKSGELHPDALLRARKCLEKFKKLIEAHQVKKILAMATSAARDARNGQELFDIGKELEIPIEVIPGESEARISYQGATCGLEKGSKTILVIDIGGGSTELIVGRNDEILFSQSLNIGAVRVTEKFVTRQPIELVEQTNLSTYVNSQIGVVIPEIKKFNIDQIIAVAGTPTSIAAIEVGGFDENKVDGFVLTKDRLQFWADEFAKTSVEEKQTKYQLAGRADIIFGGTTILLKILHALDISSLVVSTKGVRYGVAIEMLRASSLTDI